MNVKITEDVFHSPEEEVIILCQKKNERITQLQAFIEGFDAGIQGSNDGKLRSLRPQEILYFEVVDGKTFAYLNESVWQVQGTLERFETELEHYGFFRVSKSCMLNLKRVDHFESSMGSRITATMENNEDIIISRHYAKMLRERMKAERDRDYE